MLNLRPDRDGKIAGYEGLDEEQSAVGEWILDSHLPPPGSATMPVEGGYMANAWIRLRHPDHDGLRQMLEAVGRTVRVRVARFDSPRSGWRPEKPKRRISTA